VSPTRIPSDELRGIITERDPQLRFRPTLLSLESVLSLAALEGCIQLLSGKGTPPRSVLEPLGLTTWTLPAGWLLITVAAPSALAAWLAWQRSPWAPPAVLLASGLIALEVLVQIPFLGFSVLQPILGAAAVAATVMALLARRSGWWPARASVRSPGTRIS
jgi:hypothetical protein